MKQDDQMLAPQFRGGLGLPLTVGVCALIVGACTSQVEAPAPVPSPKQTLLEANLPAEAVTGEVSGELLDAIIDDLGRQENVRREDIEVERAEYVIWPDGSLGCPRPGEMYTHAEVPGYWVVLRHAGMRYDYRASVRGSFRRCSNTFKRQLPVG